MAKKLDIIPYRKDLKEKARILRNDSTLSEVLLWQEIGKNQLGIRFNRQVPMLDYIVDFYCKELKIIIEIDGESHTYEEAPEKDKIRQQRIEEYGVTFLRFDDLDVKRDMPWVLNTVLEWIEEHK